MPMPMTSLKWANVLVADLERLGSLIMHSWGLRQAPLTTMTNNKKTLLKVVVNLFLRIVGNNKVKIPMVLKSVRIKCPMTIF